MAMQTKHELTIQFIQDVNEICSSLIAHYNLKFKKEAHSLSSPLDRWLDFTHRRIKETPRRILIPRNSNIQLNQQQHAIFLKMLQAIEAGRDLNPYQSTGLTRNNDTSGKDKRNRTDLLWADWGIHHLHISEIRQENGYFMQRSNLIAFFIFDDQFARLIDIKNHNQTNLFSNTNLIEKAIKSYPELFNKINTKGAKQTIEKPTAATLSKLRRAGVNTLTEVNGELYFPLGQGITSAATSIKTSDAVLQVSRAISVLANKILNPEGQFILDINNEKEAPTYSLAIYRNSLVIHEQTSNKVYYGGQTLEKLQNIILPDWVPL